MAAPKTKETRRNLFVGGLHEEVDEQVLRAAFIPFGDIEDVNVPTEMGGTTGNGEAPVRRRNRGFGFVTFELTEDALAAIENMSDSEIWGKRVRVNFARNVGSGGPGKAVWAESEAWGTEVLDPADAAALEAEKKTGVAADDGLKPT